MNSPAPKAESGVDDLSPTSTEPTKKKGVNSLQQSLSKQRARLTLLMFRLAAVAVGLSWFARMLNPKPMTVGSTAPVLASLLGLVGVYVLLKKNRVLWAAYLFTYPTLIIIPWVMVQQGGLQTGVAVFFLPVIIFSSATLGHRGLFAFASAVMTVLLGIAALDIGGYLSVSPLAEPKSTLWLKFILALGMSAWLLKAILDALQTAQSELAQASKEQKDAQTRYFKAQKLEPVAQLASGIAHDFNNLLGVIANVASSLRVEMKQDDSSQELLDDLDEATARASLMTGQLLAFSRRRALKMEIIDVDEFVQSLTPLLGRLIGDEIVVSCHGTAGGLTVRADRGQLEQVMLNLVVNARDAMSRGGQLAIELGVTPSKHVYLSVSDTGVGIPETVRSNIFKAFFTTKSTGTGLGLATVADIVGRLGGRIELESEEGKGSTFRVILPGSELPASEVRKSLSRFRTQQSSARVLLAEDHELMRRGTQRVLEQAGYTVTSVVNGLEALALIQGGATFDVLVSDVSMPHLSGFDLIERLSEFHLGLPTLFISGHARRLPEHFEELPFRTRFLAKPFAQEDLMAGLEKCLAPPERVAISEGSSR